MLPEFVPAWRAVENGKADILRRARALPADVFRAPRKPGEWSFAQTLHHLAIAEGLVIGQMAALKSGQVSPPAKPAFLVSGLTRLMQWGVPLPAPLPMLPPPNSPPISEITALWDEKRAAFEAGINGVRGENRDAPVALHPIFGPLSALQVLRLAKAHQAYHLRQFPSSV